MANGVVGALARLQGRREDIPQVAPGGENIPSPGLLGGLVAGRGINRIPPRTQAEREERIAENSGFLQQPEVQAALLQFAVNIMQPVGGDGGMADFAGAIGRSIGGAAAAAGRVGENQLLEDQLARENALEERRLQISEGELGLKEAQLGLEASQMVKNQQMLEQRQKLLEGALDPQEVDPQVLFGLAQEFLVAGDTDMAEEFRQLGKAVAGEEAPSATAIIEGPAMSPKMEELAISSIEKADELDNQVTELEVTKQMAANAETGALTPVTLPVSNALRQIGIEVAQDVPLLQALRAQQSQLALRFRNPDSGFGLPGSASNKDITFLKQTVGDLGNTPEANIAILTILIAKQRRSAQLSRMRAEHILTTGSLRGWSDVQKKFIEENSMFTPEEQTLLESLSGTGNIDRTPPDSGAEQASPDQSVEQGFVLPESPPEGSDPAVVSQWDWIRANWDRIQKEDPQLADEILNPQPLPARQGTLPSAQPTSPKPPLGRSLLDFFTGN